MPSEFKSGEPAGRFALHMVSDSTGETVTSVVRACLSQFEEVQPEQHFWNLVRSDRQLDFVVEEIERHRGVVVYTLVDEDLRRRLHGECARLSVPCISVLDPVIAAFGQFLGKSSARQPGRQYELNAAYFSRIDAVEFTLAHDDGQATSELHEADIVLVGVSRTSKTPTSLYLANRSLRVANVPMVPGVPLPPELDEITRPLIVGLTKDPASLVQIRRQRLLSLQQGDDTDYTELEAVRDEVTEARRYFARRGWPVIDVTRRAIEETSAEILTLYSRRKQQQAAGGPE